MRKLTMILYVLLLTTGAAAQTICSIEPYPGVSLCRWSLQGENSYPSHMLGEMENCYDGPSCRAQKLNAEAVKSLQKRAADCKAADEALERAFSSIENVGKLASEGPTTLTVSEYLHMQQAYLGELHLALTTRLKLNCAQ